jgi:hypothetical protein
VDGAVAPTVGEDVAVGGEDPTPRERLADGEAVAFEDFLALGDALPAPLSLAICGEPTSWAAPRLSADCADCATFPVDCTAFPVSLARGIDPVSVACTATRTATPTITEIDADRITVALADFGSLDLTKPGMPVRTPTVTPPSRKSFSNYAVTTPSAVDPSKSRHSCPVVKLH